MIQTNKKSSQIKKAEESKTDKFQKTPNNKKEKSFLEQFPKTPPEEKQINHELNVPLFDKVSLFLIFINILLCVGLVFLAIFYLNEKETVKTEQEITPISEEEATAISEPTPTLDLSLFTLKVLNGSGLAGDAGKAAVLLEDGGFENISVGEADSYDYSGIEVSFKENLPEEVLDNIRGIFATDSVKKGSQLENTSPYDIVIIVGAKTSQ